MPQPDRRYTRHAGRVNLVNRSDGAPSTIVGYAAVFYDANDPDTEYQIWDDVKERIMPGAFDRAMKEDDVRALFNHDDNLILGRTSANTLRLSVDRRGLKYEIDPPDTQTARDLLVSLQRGDVSGSSFSFRPKDTTNRVVDGVYIVERNDVHLFDVGPVCFPAYKATEASARSAAEDPAQVRREVDLWAKDQAEATQARIATAKAEVARGAGKVSLAIAVDVEWRSARMVS